jgi:hypothetical protein
MMRIPKSDNRNGIHIFTPNYFYYKLMHVIYNLRDTLCRSLKYKLLRGNSYDIYHI